MPRVLMIAVMLAVPATSAAAPLIDRSGVRNAASLLPPGLPGGGLAPGALFVIRGRQLGPSPLVRVDSPVEELAGVTVRIDVGKTSWQAQLLEAGDGEIRAMVPRGIALGMASVAVIREGQTSIAVYTKVVAESVGIFTVSRDGTGPVREQPARRGDAITLRVTGLGADPAAPTPEVFVAGHAVQSVLVVRSAQCCGVGQITFGLPAEAPAGCGVPVQVRSSGSIPSNVVTLAVEPLPPSCFDLVNVRWALQQKGAVGFAIPFRLSMFYEVERGAAATFTGDALVAGFRSGALRGGIGGLLYPPPPGACTLYTAAVALNEIGSELRSDLLADTKRLDGGSFTVSLPGGIRKEVPRVPVRDNYEYGLLGGHMFDQVAPSPPLFLRPGKVTVETGGNTDIPAFGVSVQFPEPIVWTNRKDADVVDRTRELEVRWDRTGANQHVAIAGMSMDKPGRATAAFLCVVSAADRRFRVPVPILQSLPPNRTRHEDSLAYIMIGTLPDASYLFPVVGLDKMFAAGVSLDGRTVRFK